MFEKIKKVSAALWEQFTTKASMIQFSFVGLYLVARFLPGLLVPNSDPGGQLTRIGCVLQNFGYQFAFYGAILGVMLYGIYKIISVVNPNLAGQVSNYLKDAAFGLIMVGIASGLVTLFATSVFGEGFQAGTLCANGG